MRNTSAVSLDGIETDWNQNWKVVSWQSECYNFVTSGCEVLTVMIEKDWDEWDDTEDIDFNAKTY